MLCEFQRHLDRSRGEMPRLLGWLGSLATSVAGWMSPPQPSMRPAMNGEDGEGGTKKICTKLAPKGKHDITWSDLKESLILNVRNFYKVRQYLPTGAIGVFSGVRSTTPTATTIVAIGRRCAAQRPLVYWCNREFCGFVATPCLHHTAMPNKSE